MSDDERPYARLEARLGHTFSEVVRLESALTHKSYLNENPTWGRGDNERLEFLGDAVLDLVIGHLLMEAYPERSEGELSKLRSAIVHEPGLAQVAAEMGLGEWLFLGRGEEHSGGRKKASVLADAVEAVIAAIYLDGGFAAAFEAIRGLFAARVAALGAGAPAGAGDYKTRLQELAARGRFSVRYVVVAESGPDHAKIFEVAVQLQGRPAFSEEREAARGTGRTKKEAEQQAAAACIAALEAEAEAKEASPKIVDSDEKPA